MTLRSPHPLSEEKLQKLSTQRLLEVLKLARRWALGGTCDSCGMHRLVCIAVSEEDRAREKSFMDEAEAYETLIKRILAGRPHVERRA